MSSEPAPRVMVIGYGFTLHTPVGTPSGIEQFTAVWQRSRLTGVRALKLSSSRAVSVLTSSGSIGRAMRGACDAHARRTPTRAPGRRAARMLAGMLDRILTPGLAAWLADAPEPQTYRTPAELDRVLVGWARAGAQITGLGASRSGRPIRAASFGHGPRSLLAWGYPHPDEPLGAEALVWLGDALAAGRLPDLAGWTVHLLLCADPDETQRNTGWMQGPRTAEAFARGVWRPQQLGWEVDYGLELDWGAFVPLPDGAEQSLTRCASRAECARRCGPGGCVTRGRPHRPLPESAAIARAIDRFRPDVAATMHGVAAGASYTFLAEREHPRVLDDLLAIPGLAGAGRYLGEPIDAGRRWRTFEPDLIKERTLTDRVRALEATGGYDPELLYYATVSAGCYLQAQGRGGQLITPEAAQFRHPDFSDPAVSAGVERALVSVEDRRRGRYAVVRIDVDGDWVVAQQDRAGGQPLSAARGDCRRADPRDARSARARAPAPRAGRRRPGVGDRPRSRLAGRAPVPG